MAEPLLIGRDVEVQIGSSIFRGIVASINSSHGGGPYGDNMIYVEIVSAVPYRMSSNPITVDSMINCRGMISDFLTVDRPRNQLYPPDKPADPLSITRRKRKGRTFK